METVTTLLSPWQTSELTSDISAELHRPVSAGLIASWKHRNSIPPRYWRAIIASAVRRGIAGVTYERLAQMAAGSVAA